MIQFSRILYPTDFSDQSLHRARNVEASYGVVLELGAEALRLFLVENREVRPGDRLRETRVILDLSRIEDLPTDGLLLDHQCLQHGTYGVNRSGEPRSASSDDEYVVLRVFGHGSPFLSFTPTGRQLG